jgi:hypothetical protein
MELLVIASLYHDHLNGLRGVYSPLWEYRIVDNCNRIRARATQRSFILFQTIEFVTAFTKINHTFNLKV